MKSTFEVDCYIEEIEKEDNIYKVTVETEDNRNFYFEVREEKEKLHFENLFSSYRIWHREQVLLNVLSSILFSEQKNYWDKFIPEKEYNYNKKKLDLEELQFRHKFIKKLYQIENWLDNLYKSDATKDTYRRSLRVFLQYCVENGADLSTFGITDVQEFLNTLKDKKKIINKDTSTERKVVLSPYYVEKVYFAISKYIQAERPELEKFFREMVSIPEPPNLLEEAPKSLEKIKVNEIMRELERSIYEAEGSGSTVRYYERIRNYAIVRIFFETGIRLSELANLDFGDVVIEKTARRSHFRVLGKGNKIRQVSLNSDCINALKSFLPEREAFLKSKGIENDAVFISNQAKRMSTRSIYRIFEKFGTHPHAARHTKLTELVRKGTDIVAVKQIAGHTNINTTARYSKPTLEEMYDILEN